MRLAQQLALGYIRAKFRILASVSKRRAAEKAFILFCTPQHRNRKKLPPVFEKAEKIRFEFAGERIAGYRWLVPAARGKVQIIHGFESSVINFDRYIKPLMQKGFEVYAFDAPAHGRSTGKTINAAVYRDFLQHIYTSYGPMDAFICHSFGGLCMSLALENLPPREGRKLVLVAPAVETTRAIDNFFRFLQLDERIRPEFENIIYELGGKPSSWYSINRALDHISAEVLFLQDKDDMMTPYADVIPVMEKKLPNIRFIISEGLGHRRIYRDNKTTRTILEFLD